MTYNDLSKQKTPETKPLVTPAPANKAEAIPPAPEAAPTVAEAEAAPTKA